MSPSARRPAASSRPARPRPTTAPLALPDRPGWVRLAAGAVVPGVVAAVAALAALQVFVLNPLDAELARRFVAAVAGKRLVADVEGLTILRDGGQSFLIASSQGDSAYGVWRIAADRLAWVGRFRIGGPAIDPVTQTDGVDAWSGPIGPFPDGAIAVHDHCDGDGPADPAAAACDGDTKQQNYKLVDWREVRAVLGIQPPRG